MYLKISQNKQKQQHSQTFGIPTPIIPTLYTYQVLKNERNDNLVFYY